MGSFSRMQRKIKIIKLTLTNLDKMINKMRLYYKQKSQSQNSQNIKAKKDDDSLLGNHLGARNKNRGRELMKANDCNVDTQPVLTGEEIKTLKEIAQNQIFVDSINKYDSKGNRIPTGNYSDWVKAVRGKQ